jgi:hypothetical protein
VRVRVRFRYNADTGDVESFVVEDLGGADRAVDHDALHDRITADVARVVERDALIEEVLPEALSSPAEDRGSAVDSERTERRVRE